MPRLRCPQCSTLFDQVPGVAPSCPSCRYGAGATKVRIGAPPPAAPRQAPALGAGLGVMARKADAPAPVVPAAVERQARPAGTMTTGHIVAMVGALVVLVGLAALAAVIGLA